MLTDIVTTYLSVRRAVGFKLHSVEKCLWSYANFATARGDIRVLSATAVEWAALASSENQRANRLKVLIRFARFARAGDSGHEIPPDNVFCTRCNRRTPYIFTNEEVKQLILHAARLGPADSLRPHTYSTLFGLLASTGLRISEALSLRFQDITAEGLVIRETKFRKSRLVWLHETVVVALQKYLLRRAKFASIDDHLFVSRRGGKLCYAIVAETFQEVLKAAGIQARPGGPKPRLHDFRHRFAVKALEASPDTRDRITRHMLALSTYMGHARLESTYWYLESTPQLMADIADLCESFTAGRKPMTPIAPHITAFLRERLPLQRGASAHTCESYAYTFQLLFEFASNQYKVTPSKLYLEQIDAVLVMDFLAHIEATRDNSARTRNARLAAIKSFMRFVEHRVPSVLEQSLRILAIPSKKVDMPLIRYLSITEMEAILNAPDLRTRSGIRDRAMLHLGFAAGLRVSELTGLLLTGVSLQPTPTVCVMGKGRKQRSLPLWKQTAADIRAWLAVRDQSSASELFLNAGGRPMTRVGFTYLLRKHVSTAARSCPSLLEKQVSPHLLRHTCAMMIFQATGDLRKVSLWLGHAHMQTTEMYLRADPTEKIEAIEGVTPPALRRGRFTVPDKLIASLRGP